MERSRSVLGDQELELLIAELHHLGRIQVDAEEQYVSKSNNLIVFQGLLAVAAGSVGSMSQESFISAPVQAMIFSEVIDTKSAVKLLQNKL